MLGGGEIIVIEVMCKIDEESDTVDSAYFIDRHCYTVVVRLENIDLSLAADKTTGITK